jgi:hypothetical protein
MTQAVGAHSTYDEPIATGGNREDLSDMLFDVSPTETPGVTAMKKNSATATSSRINLKPLPPMPRLRAMMQLLLTQHPEFVCQTLPRYLPNLR